MAAPVARFQLYYASNPDPYGANLALLHDTYSAEGVSTPATLFGMTQSTTYPLAYLAFFLLLASKPLTISQFNSNELFTSTTIHVNQYNNKFILEYNYPNTSKDLALATVVHYGLHSQ